ncbi:M23 family metallopeptidase [uncultured Marinobacter sp.]|uniref:M23 family metallopeptidase n=1 Tax=uncultured Marinobacter sp. TaxID=187379 RepID=UPI0030DAB17A
MNIILVSKNHGRSRAFALNPTAMLVVALLTILVLVSCVWAGYRYAAAQAAQQPVVPGFILAEWQGALDAQLNELEVIERNAREQIDAMTLRLGDMQGRLLRLDALGQRFVEAGKVAAEEFDFDQPVAMGGPEDDRPGESFAAPELNAMIAQLDQRIRDREQQLRLLDTLMSSEKLENQSFVAGRPITWGWLSSKYGYRTDPFNGRRTWHNGVDLAGKEGGEVIAVAAGVVTFSGDRSGYGNFIEIDHGDGLVTRYAHGKENLVSTGDVVQRGEQIAVMGSTGRSTGPHVHFEVLRNGRGEDPVKYISRASR